MTSVSDGDDVLMTSSTQSESNKVYCNTLVKGNPPEGKTTAVVAVMRGKSKHGYHRHHSTKYYKKQIVRVLLDSGSDGDLFFVNNDKPMLLPYSKRLVPQSWNTSNGIFQTKRKARVEPNFFDYSDSKRYYSKPEVEYRKDSKPQYDLILGNETMKALGIVLDFKSKTITIDKITLPMRNINLLQGSSTLRALKLNLSCFLPGNLPGNYQILPKTSDLGQSCGKVHDSGKITAFTCLPYLTVPYRCRKICVSVPPKKHRT
jgi:hypothetical protein